MGVFWWSTAGDPKICGDGGTIYISDEHYFSFKAGLGIGTNNFVEICALKLLLTLAREKHIVKFQLFGDSQLVINWANGKFWLLNLELAQVHNEVNRLSDLFELLELKHIYRLVDGMAKVGVQITEEFWDVTKYHSTVMVESYQQF